MQFPKFNHLISFALAELIRILTFIEGVKDCYDENPLHERLIQPL